MSADHLLIALLVTVLALIAVIFLTLRFIRRGLSQKYQRPTKSAKEMTPWNALNAGEDPTL
jgi:hypothetical protein